MKHLIILFCLLISNISNAQIPTIKWGSEQPEGRFDELLLFKDGIYFGSRTYGNFFEDLRNNYVTSFSVIQGVEVTKTVLLTREIAGKKVKYEGMTVIKDQLVVFFSVLEKETYHIYRQVFTSDLVATSEVEIGTFEIPDKYNSESAIHILKSSNGHFGGVLYTMDNMQTNELSFGYAVLDSTCTPIAKNTLVLPMEVGYMTAGTYLLANNGDFYITYNEKVSQNRNKLNNGSRGNFRIGPFSIFPMQSNYNLVTNDELDAIQRIHAYKFKNGQVTKVTHKLEKTSINNYKLLVNSDSNVVICGSFLRTKGDKMINRSELSMNGIFTINIDFQNLKVVSEKYSDVALNVYTYGMSERKKTRVESNLAGNMLLPKLYDYKLKNVTCLTNGNIVGHLEQTVRNVTYSSYNNGFGGYGYGGAMGGYSPYNTTVNITYYFKDIIVFCLKSDGSVLWMKKILKSQTSTEYNGAYVSSFAFISDNQYNLLFTDNIKNYAENGIFIATRKIHGNPVFAKNNIVSKVSIVLETGQTKRDQFLLKLEQDGCYIPRDFKYDPIRKSLLLVSDIGVFGNKIRLGVTAMNE